MEQYFTIGEFAKLHKFSRQTLIFYDKIGVLKPDFIDPENGYRYYGSEKLEILDLLYILKEAGVSLTEIKNFMENRSVTEAVNLFQEKVMELDKKIQSQIKIKNRLEAKVIELKKARDAENYDFENKKFKVYYENVRQRYVFKEKVRDPNLPIEVDIAIKNLFENARIRNVEHNYQLIMLTPLEKIQQGKYTENSHATTIIEKTEYERIRKAFPDEKNLVGKIPSGLYAIFYHKGPYRDTGETYEKAIKLIASDGYQGFGVAYEESVIDCMTSKDENNYITKIMIKVKEKNKG